MKDKKLNHPDIAASLDEPDVVAYDIYALHLPDSTVLKTQENSMGLMSYPGGEPIPEIPISKYTMVYNGHQNILKIDPSLGRLTLKRHGVEETWNEIAGFEYKFTPDRLGNIEIVYD